ncbi:hypothetical protein [Modicisalibacter xianhensis]|nr:hypothetical protein [Halomonas xianhensis]
MSKKKPMTPERQRHIQRISDKAPTSPTNKSGFKERAQRTVDKKK